MTSPSSFSELRPVLAPGRPPAVAVYPPGATFGPRALPDFEFVWILEGSARWRCTHPTRREVTLGPGTLLLATPGMRDAFTWDHQHQTQHAYVHFELGGVDPCRWPLVRRPALDSPLLALFRYVLWLADEPGGGARERLGEMLAVMLRLFVWGPLPDSPGAATVPTRLAPVLDHVGRVWAREGLRGFTLSELAGVAGISTGYLNRLFHARFGSGVIAALERVRLEHAAVLLERSNLAVAQVAAACGYADPYHFSRRFNAVYGIAPRVYRQVPGTTGNLVLDPRLRPLARRLVPGRAADP